MNPVSTRTPDGPKTRGLDNPKNAAIEAPQTFQTVSRGRSENLLLLGTQVNRGDDVTYAGVEGVAARRRMKSLEEGGETMFDHFGFVVRDLATSLRFYEASLAPLGLRVAERHGNEAVIISGEAEFPFIWMKCAGPWAQNAPHPCYPLCLSFTATALWSASVEDATQYSVMGRR